MKPSEVLRFVELRDELFTAIKDALAGDGHCKSYEGAFTVRLPNYHEQDDQGAWQIALDCYVIGPNRHYYWNGDSFADALQQAEKDIRKWIAEFRDEAE